MVASLCELLQSFPGCATAKFSWVCGRAPCCFLCLLPFGGRPGLPSDPKDRRSTALCLAVLSSPSLAPRYPPLFLSHQAERCSSSAVVPAPPFHNVRAFATSTSLPLTFCCALSFSDLGRLLAVVRAPVLICGASHTRVAASLGVVGGGWAVVSSSSAVSAPHRLALLIISNDHGRLSVEPDSSTFSSASCGDACPKDESASSSLTSASCACSDSSSSLS